MHMQKGIIFASIMLALSLIGSTVVHILIEKFVSSTQSVSLQVAKKIAQKINAPKDSKVADLGCGSGQALLSIVNLNRAKGIGYEISPLMAIAAKYNTILSWPRIKIIAESFLKSDLTEQEIDIIFLNVPQPIIDSFTKQAKQLLKQDVQIFILNAQLKGVKKINTHSIDKKNTLFEY